MWILKLLWVGMFTSPYQHYLGPWTHCEAGAREHGSRTSTGKVEVFALRDETGLHFRFELTGQGVTRTVDADAAGNGQLRVTSPQDGAIIHATNDKLFIEHYVTAKSQWFITCAR